MPCPSSVRSADKSLRTARGRAAAVALAGALSACIALVPALRCAWAVTPLAVLAAFVLCRAFPQVTVVMHQTPLYYDDLDKKEARQVFSALSSVTMALLLGAVLDYGMFRFAHSNLSGFELVGVVGGMLSIYGKAHEVTGKALLHAVQRRAGGTPRGTPTVELARANIDSKRSCTRARAHVV